MSRRYFALPVAVGALAGLSFLLAWWCVAGGRARPRTRRAVFATEGYRQEAGFAGAVLEESVHHFGVLDPTERCEHTFVVRNEGNAPLTLTRGTTSCKCTMSDLPETSIPPGGSAPVRIASKISQTSGDFSHSANIFTNDPRNRKITLRIEGTIRHYVGARPATISLLGMRRGESASAEATIYSQVWDGFRIEEVASTLEGMTWQVAPAEPGVLRELEARSGYRVRVELPAGLPGGRFRHELRMSAVPDGQSAAARTFVLNIAGSVPSRISIYGDTIDSRQVVRLGLVRQGEGLRERLTMKIRDDHRQLRIERVETEPDFLRASVTPYNPKTEKLGLYKIDLEVPPDAPVADYLSRRGRIRIISDHPELPVLFLEVAFAVVRR